MALTDKLSAIGVAIRKKTGGTKLLTLDAMPAEILSITTGEGGGTGDCNGRHIPDEALVISGGIAYGFQNNRWNWFFEECGDEIVTENLADANYAFSSSTNLREIPFDLNFNTSSTNHNIKNMFSGCDRLLTIPKFVGCKPSNMDYMFSNCYDLNNIPEDIEDWFDWSWMDSQTGTGSSNRSATFASCWSLRSVPMGFFNHAAPKTRYNYTYYNYGFSNCVALDEVVGLPIPYTATYTSNMFVNTFNECNRLKELTFATQEDGSPIVVNWSNQTIDLSTVGWVTSEWNIPNITGRNSGITEDKQVTDDASYAALKNDPDWFTANVLYSRYNHDSAVNTINSLPDASSGSGNVIKFKRVAGDGDYGSLGKSISNLTDAEIAVAAAKGWTVSLV